MSDFSFSPKNVAEEVQQKLVIEQMPQWAQNVEQIQKYFNDAVQHWFTPEQQMKLDGYIGSPSGMGSMDKIFIVEDDTKRGNYQLSPAYISVDGTNKILASLSYPDLIDNLSFNGSLTENENRILNGRTYSWAPPINPDMLINYSNYYWYAKNPEGVQNPEYITMERNAQDGNLWSRFNYWFPVEYIDAHGNNVTITHDKIKDGTYTPAKRPIIEYKNNIQLMNFGKNSRLDVNYLCTDLLPEELMFRSISDGIKVDGAYIKEGDRILFTSITNPGENNRVYKVTIKNLNSVDTYGLILDPVDITSSRPTGEPQANDTVRITSGSTYKNTIFYWDGAKWVKGQQKTDKNQHPLFMLFDKNKIRLDDSTVYPNSTFSGSKLFSYKLNRENAEDSILGFSIDKDPDGNVIFENNIQSDYSYLNGTISGMKFYKNIVTGEFESDWQVAPVPSRQYVQSVYELVKDDNNNFPTEFQMPMPIGVNEANVFYPLIEVDVSGEFLNYTQKTSYSDLLNMEYFVQGDVLTVKYPFSEGEKISISVFNANETPDLEVGAYEIPKGLKNNANNEKIVEIKITELAKHFFDIISAQKDFSGSAYGYNNYSKTKKDLSLGREILQHDASLIPLMAHNSSDKLDIIRAIEFAKTSYNSFKNKFNQKLNVINNDGTLNSAIAVVKDIIESINVGKSDEFAFWLSGMAKSALLEQTFIPPTPQYLGVLQVYKPQMNTRINGFSGIYNISHTGAISRAFSVLENSDGNESIIVDFRDEVLYELENLIYNSINSKFTSDDYVPMVSKWDVEPTLFRSTEYSMDEWDKISRRNFEQWAITNSVDYSSNDDWDIGNWKTWNYSETTYSKNSKAARGNWKGIYLDYFETIEPNTKPWEMLGFTVKPQWFDIEYKSTNINGVNYYLDPILWDDLDRGYIRAGSRKGVDKRFIREFTKYNPIKDNGEIVAPHEVAMLGRSPLVQSEPQDTDKNKDWVFGDIGNIEFGYRSSNFFAFDTAESIYRAKPAQWSNYFWETAQYSLVDMLGSTQWLNEHDLRIQFNTDTYVHGENETAKIGYQMWVSDYLKHNHMDISTYYGNIVRGSTVKLMHKLGGFTKKENLSFVSDNFGLVSQENQQVQLIKSAVKRQEVLSALKVTYTDSGFKIEGFDGVYPYLKYYEPKKASTRYSVDIQGHQLVHYDVYESNQIKELKYGTTIRTIQEVYNFICGYGEYLEDHGWIFEDLTEDSIVFNWVAIGSLFAEWAYGNRSLGDYATLSPSSTSCKFGLIHGHVDSVTQFSGGSWTLVDTNYNGINSHEVDTTRIGNITKVSLLTTNRKIGLIRLNIVEFEHAIVFDNKTIFGDIIYLPAFGLHQRRLKTYGNITADWVGRLSAPGFMVVGSDMLPNFEKLVSDFGKYYNNENPSSSTELNDLSKHLIGFQSREYLRNLILNDRSQIDFYKGYIKEKGTQQSFKKVLRTAKNLNTKNYKILEEWAFKVGEYGDVDNEQHLEFLLNSNLFKQDPQIVVFDENITSDDIMDNNVTYFGTKGVDSRWITRNSKNKFPSIRRLSSNIDVPNSGPVNLNDVDVTAENFLTSKVARMSYLKNTGTMPTSVWITDDAGEWNIYDILDTGLKVSSIADMDDTASIVYFEGNHNLSENDVIFMYATDSLVMDLNEETFYQNLPTLSSASILFNTKLTARTFDTQDSRTPRLFKYHKRMNAAQKAQFIQDRNINIPDNGAFLRPVIYNKNTNCTDTYLTPWDPLLGIFPGIASSEIKYKTQVDPADYNSSDASVSSWGAEHVGEVWWDTSTAHYIDYAQPIYNGSVIDKNRTLSYRRENWGKMLPGSSIDIYEWVRSPVPPYNWDTYVQEQSQLNKEEGTWVPSGEFLLDSWSEISEYNKESNDYKTYYYFWVKNSTYVPDVSFRYRSTASVAKIIESPTALDIPWFAAIAENAFIISGISELITDNQSVLQLKYMEDYAGSKPVHQEWKLFMEGSEYSFDADIWNNMINSLKGSTWDSSTSSTTDLVYPGVELGNGTNKTWFKNIKEARREFVSACNSYFRSINVIGGDKWTSILNYSAEGTNKFRVNFTVQTIDNENVIEILNSSRISDMDGVYFSTNGELPTPLIKVNQYYLKRIEGSSQYFRVYETLTDGALTISTKGLGYCYVIRSTDLANNDLPSWKMTDFWETTDWYSSNYSSNTSMIEYNSLDEATRDNPAPGDIVKITDGAWVAYIREYAKTGDVWTAIAKEASTIQLNDKLFSSAIYENGVFTDEDVIIQSAIEKLASGFTSVQSRIVFPMIHYVHAEQKVLDWVFKTSYISITGIQRALSDTGSDNVMENILDYFKEVKPYRTKIRTVIDQRSDDNDSVSIGMYDTDPSAENRMLIANEAKNEIPNYSSIPHRFRESSEIVFFDIVSADKENTIDANAYKDLIPSIIGSNDASTRNSTTIEIQGCPTAQYNGSYVEILDIPAFSPTFNNLRGSILVDRTKGVYVKDSVYVWNQIGKGWCLSSIKTDSPWYYEYLDLNGVSAELQSMSSIKWMQAGPNPSELRTSIYVGMTSTCTLGEKVNQYLIDRYSTSFSVLDLDVLDVMLLELQKHVQLDNRTWETMIKTFVIVQKNHENYFDLNKFIELSDTLFIAKSTLLDIFVTSMNNYDNYKKYRNSGNRIRFFNTDATEEYVQEILNYGFKGTNIQNRPRYRVPFGYSPLSSNEDQYTLSSTALYYSVRNALIRNGKTTDEADALLSEYGFSLIAGYGKTSITIDSETIDDMEPNPYNPLISYDKELLDGFADDMHAYDNLGYDKATRSIVFEEIESDQYLYDISKLDTDKKLSNFRVTISNYQPKKFNDVDFGIYLSNGTIKPDSQIGDLTVDYEGFETNNTSKFDWDFGRMYGDSFGKDFGSFSVEAEILRDPKNHNNVIVSVPRSVEKYKNDWDDISVDFKNSEKYLYQFKVQYETDSIKLPNHTLLDGDNVIIFSSDTDPAGAVFNDVQKLYTVKVLNSSEIQILDGVNVITLVPIPGVIHQCSLFLVVKPSAMNTIRIDYMNYDNYYGRIYDCGELFENVSINLNTITIQNHKLKSTDKIKILAHAVNLDLGDVKDGEEYYVHKVNENEIQLVNTVVDSITGENVVQLHADMDKVSISVVNVWYDGSVYKTVRNNDWFDHYQTLTRSEKIQYMKTQFDSEGLIANVSDVIVETDFPRPNIDKGSLRDLTRFKMEERLSITVFQDDRNISSEASKVYSTSGVYMYNNTNAGSNPYSFRIEKYPDGITWNTCRLDENSCSRLVVNFNWDDDSLVIDTNPVLQEGTLEINGEYIKYKNVQQLGDSSFKLSGIKRQYHWSYLNRIHEQGSLVKFMDIGNTILSRGINKVDLSDAVDLNMHSTATNYMFNLLPNGISVPLKSDNSSIGTEVRKYRGSYSKLK